MADRIIEVKQEEIKVYNDLDYLLDNLIAVASDENKSNVCKAQIKAKFKELTDRNKLLVDRIDNVKYSFDMLLDAIDEACDEYTTIRILKEYASGGFR